MTPLPAWIDREAWEDYAAMRARIKRPLTARMIRQKLARCAELRDAGHDVNASIDAATEAQWLDFYVPREKSIPEAPGREAEKTSRALSAEAARPLCKPSAAVQEHMRKIKAQRTMT